MMHRAERGFTMVELLVVLAITSILSAVALPLMLGAREKARIAACDKAYAVVAGELKVRMEEKLTAGDPTPADSAIDDAIDRFGIESYKNPRNRNEPAYVKTVPGFVPVVDSSCIVHLYDGSDALSERIVFTQYEGGIRSYRIALD